MKTESFGKLLLKGIGYIIFGNVLCVFMTMAVHMFGNNLFTNALAIILGTAIFYSLVFTVAWKHGSNERKLVKFHNSEGLKKHLRLAVWLIMFVFAAVPSVVLLLNKLVFPDQDLLLPYQFVSGSSYPFVLAFVPPVESDGYAWVASEINRVDSVNVLFPVLMIAYYALIPVTTQLGYWAGFNDKLNADKIVYK